MKNNLKTRKGPVIHMHKKILYVGLDVDSKHYHGAVWSKEEGFLKEFKVKASLELMLKTLRKLPRECEIRVCYEAAFIGFTLQRDLASNGIHCDVIAPSDIPRRSGDRVKTDRVDARKLGEFYMNGILTVIHVPDEELESDRNLVRSRTFLAQELTRLKQYIVMMCRKFGLDYKEFENSRQYFTGEHLKWLEMKVGALSDSSKKACFLLLLKQFRQMKEVLADVDQELSKLAAKGRYRRQVAALSCFRGIAQTFALQLITEIGNVNRFTHPRQLTSYAGLDVIEYSSGGHSSRFGITKTGNVFIRTAAVEASQCVNKTPRATKHLHARRTEVGSTPQQIEIADRCMRRLYKKANRMIFRGKHINKVKAACARELLGFVWEALKKAA